MVSSQFKVQISFLVVLYIKSWFHFFRKILGAVEVFPVGMDVGNIRCTQISPSQSAYISDSVMNSVSTKN